MTLCTIYTCTNTTCTVWSIVGFPRGKRNSRNLHFDDISTESDLVNLIKFGICLSSINDKINTDSNFPAQTFTRKWWGNYNLYTGPPPIHCHTDPFSRICNLYDNIKYFNWKIFHIFFLKSIVERNKIWLFIEETRLKFVEQKSKATLRRTYTETITPLRFFFPLKDTFV